MAKQVNKGATAPQAAKPAMVQAPVAPATATQPAQPGILQVKPGVALRGARAAWYAVLQQYNGKPVADFLAATNATPGGTGTAPSLPKSGVAEKPSGWLGYFVRTGVATVVQPATPNP